MQKYSPYRDTYRRHRKLFLGLPLAAMLIAIWFVAGAPKQYESTTALWFDNPPPQSSSITQGTDLTGITQPPAAQAQTILNELLSTRDFRTKIGREGPLQQYLATHKNAGWGPSGLIVKLKGTGSLSDRVVKALGPSAVTTRVVGPQVLAIAVHSTSPTVAAGTLKALIAEFGRERNTVQAAQGKASLAYYRAQKAGAQSDLTTATRRITTYLAANPGAKACTATQTTDNSTTCDIELKTLSDARKAASAHLVDAQNQLNQASVSLTTLPAGTAKILVIDPPRVPVAPIKGPKNIVLAAIAGLFAGFLVSLLGVIAITGAELRAAAEVRARRLDDEREAAARQAMAAAAHPRLSAAPDVEPFELVAFPPAPPAPPAPEVEAPARRREVETRPAAAPARAELSRPVAEKPAPPVEVPAEPEVEPAPPVEVPVHAEAEPAPPVEIAPAPAEPVLVEEPPPAEPAPPRAPRKRTPARNHKVPAAEAAEAVAAVSDNGAVSDASVADLQAAAVAPSRTEEVEQPTEAEIPAGATAAVEEAPKPSVGERRRPPRTGARNRKTPAPEAPVAEAVPAPDVPAAAIEPTPVVEQAPEPVVEQAPEPVVEQTSEPVVAEAPEPVVAEAPEPVVEEAPPPVVAERRRPPRTTARSRKAVASEAPVAPPEVPAPSAEAESVVEVEEAPEPVVAEAPEPVVEETPPPVVAERRRPPRTTARSRKAAASEVDVAPAEVPAPSAEAESVVEVEEAPEPLVAEAPEPVVEETPPPVVAERRRRPRTTARNRKATASEAEVEETPEPVVEETPPPVVAERRRPPRTTARNRKAVASEAPVAPPEVPAPSAEAAPVAEVEETPEPVAEEAPPAVVAESHASASGNGATPSESTAEEPAPAEAPAAPATPAPRLFAKLGKSGRFKGTVLGVRNDGEGRRRRPIWTVRQEREGSFVPPIGGLLHLAGDTGHDGTVVAQDDAADGLVVYEIEIPEVRPSRSKTAEQPIPPLDPRWVGTEVTFGIGPSPSARRREERRAAESRKGKSGEQRPSELPGKITSAS